MFSQTWYQMKTLFFLIAELFKFYSKKNQFFFLCYTLCFIVVSQKINEFQILKNKYFFIHLLYCFRK